MVESHEGGFLILILFLSTTIIPIYQTRIEAEIRERAFIEQLNEIIKDMTRAIIEGGNQKSRIITIYYTTSMTTLKKLKMVPITLIIPYPSDDIGIADPFDPNTYIFLEYKVVGDIFDQHTPYRVHKIKGTSATYNEFIKELGGYDKIIIRWDGIRIIQYRPKYFHFAGHGGKTSDDKPYIKIRDDENPDNFKNLYPRDIWENIKARKLSDILKLVYLSSCFSLINKKTTDEYKSFAYVLTHPKYGIGAKFVIGFDGEPNTILAMSFAKTFYELHLKDGKTITDSFIEARDKIAFELALVISIVVGILVTTLTGGIASIWYAMLIGAFTGIIANMLTEHIVNYFLQSLEIMSSSDW